MEIPCERNRWTIIPAIRREIAKMLVNDFSMSQRDVAKLLDISEAAVSNYLKGKRGRLAKLNRKTLMELRKIAREINEKKSSKPLEKNICRICRIACEGGEK